MRRTRRPEEIPGYERAQRALAAYWAARDELKALGVIRSERAVPGDFAEWLVTKMFGYQLAPSGVQRGYDATDAAGRTYQIKARMVTGLEDATSFDLRDPGFPFDFLLGVFLSPRCDVLGIVRIPGAEVLARSSVTRRSRRLRWTKALLEAPWVEVIYRKDSGS